MNLGKYVIPLSSGEVILKREGKAFWEILEENGVPAVIFKAPSNFPPLECKSKTISGMGTPDILGSYGTFTYWTEDLSELKDDVTGGRIYDIEVIDNSLLLSLQGPPNSFLRDRTPIELPVTVYVDPENPVAQITLSGERVILKEGEWSEWVRIEMPMNFFKSVPGIVRFYLKSVRPDFKLYASPINIDPLDPALPISTPVGYAAQIAEDTGLFYTQGMPEDTKALSHEVFSDKEFVQQSKLVLGERLKQYYWQLEHFEEGLLYFYFCSLDQNTHMFWRNHDPKHQLYDEESVRKNGDVVENLYIEMDRMLGETFEKIDDETTLIVMSDHGFAPFYKNFKLNTWLRENGYASLENPMQQDQVEFLMGVDWSSTKSYALGFNALYLNLRGREINGIVNQMEKNMLLEELVNKLEQIRDPENGKRVITHAYRTDRIYQGPYKDLAPDIIVGYNRGYRGSDETALGKFPDEIIKKSKFLIRYI